jgi:hypothetical protein
MAAPGLGVGDIISLGKYLYDTAKAILSVDKDLELLALHIEGHGLKLKRIDDDEALRFISKEEFVQVKSLFLEEFNLTSLLGRTMERDLSKQ